MEIETIKSFFERKAQDGMSLSELYICARRELHVRIPTTGTEDTARLLPPHFRVVMENDIPTIRRV